MFDNSVLNVVISLILIFLMYSLFATALQEAISVLLQRRSDMLFNSIKTMLSNTPDRRLPVLLLLLDNLGLWACSKKLADIWAKIRPNKSTISRRMYDRGKKRLQHQQSQICLYDQFYDHPIIKNYGQNDLFQKPNYISDSVFSSVIIDLLKNIDPQNTPKAVTMPLLIAAFNSGKQTMDAEIVQILNYYFNEAAGDLDVFRSRLEKWYNESQDRVSGWYKRTTQNWLFLIGITLAVLFNIDAVEITRYLSANKDIAAQLAQLSEVMAKDTANKGTRVLTQAEVDSLKKKIMEVNTLIGLGWGKYGQKDMEYIDCIKKNSPGYFAKHVPFFNGKREVYAALTNAKSDTIPQSLYEDHGGYLKWRYIRYKTDLSKLAGFFITAIAIGLGAPFWFDLLNKFVRIRTAGRIPGDNTPSGSQHPNNNSIDG